MWEGMVNTQPQPQLHDIKQVKLLVGRGDSTIIVNNIEQPSNQSGKEKDHVWPSKKELTYLARPSEQKFLFFHVEDNLALYIHYGI